MIWELSDDAVAGAMKLGHSNPQTQETTFPFKGTAYGRDKEAAAAAFAALVAGQEADVDDSSDGFPVGD